MDEGWVCAGCHSINLARAGRCYHCHLPRGGSPMSAAEPNVLHAPIPAAPSEDDAAESPGRAGLEEAPLPTSPIAAIDGPRRRSTLAAGLVLLLAAAVLVASIAFVPGWLAGSAGSASPLPSGALASAASTPGSTASPASSTSAPSASSPSAAPSPSGRIPGGSIGGTWLARVTLDQSGSVDLTGQVPFQDRVVDIQPGCGAEPCPTAKLAIYFLADPRPVYQATLERSGDTYRSAPVAAGTAPCLTSSGSQVPSGATVVRTIAAWRERVTTPGTAVTSDQVRGEVRYDATPTKLGDLAGCGGWSAVYEVSTEQPWSVPSLPPSPTPEPTPPPGSALVTLPVLTYPIAGARVEYFPIAGSTVASLLDSLPRSGVKACGEIQYDWYEGDPRPVGCVLPSWNQGAFVPIVGAGGACRIGVTGSALSYTVELPQWTQPQFVPKPLLDWWRRILAFIGTHEATHIRIFQRYVAMLPGRLAGVDCTGAPAVVNAWASELEAAQAAFDKADYAKPWPMPPTGY